MVDYVPNLPENTVLKLSYMLCCLNMREITGIVPTEVTLTLLIRPPARFSRCLQLKRDRF